jgi:hypothetical protein
VVVTVGFTVAVPAEFRPVPTLDMLTEVALGTFQARVEDCPEAIWLGVAENCTTDRDLCVVTLVLALAVRPVT